MHLNLDEARTSVPKGLRDRLEKIWDRAMAVTEETQYLPENIKSHRIGEPTKRLNDAVKEVLKDIPRFNNLTLTKQSINLRQTWHIYGRHGDGNENYADQNPITKETFTLIPNVLEDFDTVKKGKWTKNSKGRDVPSIEIYKVYSNGTIILADAIIENNELEIKTMVLKKPTEVKL